MCLPSRLLLICSTEHGSLVGWSLPPLKAELIPVLEPVEIVDRDSITPTVWPNISYAYPWGSQRTKVFTILPNLCPTPTNPVAINVELASSGMLRYHIVLKLSPSPTGPVVSFQLQPISIAAIPRTSPSPPFGDCFGNGITWTADTSATGRIISETRGRLNVYRAYRYREDNDPQCTSPMEFESRIYPGEILPLMKPEATSYPLAVCTLSGRVLYGESRLSSVLFHPLHTCVDYLP
jgi:hypothetical protein